MRIFPVLLLLFAPSLIRAQVIATVQNGPWTNPSTWDCNCVPAPGDSLVITHSVEITGDLTFSFPQVQVTTTGELTMSFPATVILGGTFIIEGHVLLMGWISNAGGSIDVSGSFELIGVFSTDGDIVMDGGTMQVEGDLINYMSISGDGSICVYDSTNNQGTITGTVDICDATPTTSTAPIVDLNSGTIAGTVTYCTNSACAFAGVEEAWADAVTAYPNPAGRTMTVSGLGGIKGLLLVRDATGRAVHELRLTGLEGGVQITAPAAGIFSLEIRTAVGSKSLKLIFAEGTSQ